MLVAGSDTLTQYMLLLILVLWSRRAASGCVPELEDDPEGDDREDNVRDGAVLPQGRVVGYAAAVVSRGGEERVGKRRERVPLGLAGDALWEGAAVDMVVFDALRRAIAPAAQNIPANTHCSVELVVLTSGIIEDVNGNLLSAGRCARVGLARGGVHMIKERRAPLESPRLSPVNIRRDRTAQDGDRMTRTDRNALILPWSELSSSSFWFSSVWSVVLRLG